MLKFFSLESITLRVTHLSRQKKSKGVMISFRKVSQKFNNILYIVPVGKVNIVYVILYITIYGFVCLLSHFIMN